MINEVLTIAASTLAGRIRARKVLSEDVVQAYLSRIESVNSSIGSIVQLDAARALERARQVDKEIARGGDLGPLAGVPFTVKDILETEGIITAAGDTARSDTVPKRDATVVQRMKAAGAILLGKTNCPPWGSGLETDNPLYGRTNNPYDLDRTPGGSSGGEAAAIASCFSACGLGSDSGGSLRYPAHFCGLAALKPTPGLVPLTGVLPTSPKAFAQIGQFSALRDPRTQVGPMARSVGDLALMLSIISGPDSLDGSAIPLAPGDPASVDLRGMHAAVQLDNGEVPPTLETAQAVQAASDALKNSGMIVSRCELPDEGMSLIRKIWRSNGGDMSASELYQILGEWDVFRSRMLGWLAEFDLILRPVNATPAIMHGGADPSALYTIPFSLAGWPAATVRAGTSSEGLPIGVQLIAGPWRDDVALAGAAVIEGASGGWQPPHLSVDWPRPTAASDTVSE